MFEKNIILLWGQYVIKNQNYCSLVRLNRSLFSF